MSPSNPLSGDLFDIVGRLRRSANTSSRYGQTDELMRLADEIVRWQARVRTDICRALGVASPTQLSWELMIGLVRAEHLRAEAADRHPVPGPTEDAGFDLNGVIKP